MIELQIEMDAVDGMNLVAPLGMSSPQVAITSTSVTGADWRLVSDPRTGQFAICARPTSAKISILYRFQLTGAAYPEHMFVARGSRFSRVADSLRAEAKEIAAQAGGGRAGLDAIVAHVHGLFTYGHPEERFYDSTEEIPQLCNITTGSCVDINAYLIAMLRGAGYEAGYVTGYFIPAEKQTHCEDGHCWVVTRHDEQIEHWDIAHHLKLGASPVAPGLNPKPGVRVPMAHYFGWSLPDIGVDDLKALISPLWQDPNGPWVDTAPLIRLTGYEVLASSSDNS